MRRALVDANVLLRYLTRDPPDMAERAFKLLTTAERGKVRLVVVPITVAEAVWVLESFYGHERTEIARTLIEFLHSDGLEVPDLDVLTEALVLYEEEHLDFADALVAATARREGPAMVYSFDRWGRKPAGSGRRWLLLRRG